MNNKIAIAACLAVFACTVSLPALAFKTASAPVLSKANMSKIVASKTTKKSKKISLNRKSTAVISCGKK